MKPATILAVTLALVMTSRAPAEVKRNPSAPPATARPKPTNVSAPRTLSGIEYSKPDGNPLQMDIYLPAPTGNPPPVILWIHGGAWRAGDRSNPPILSLTRHGYAIASLTYRLVPEAVFPAQIDDCRAAVRFLRTNAEKLGVDGKRIGVAGASAGGHLAALLALTPTKDPKPGDDDSVIAVADYFGPTDLTYLALLPANRDPKRPHPSFELLGKPGPDKVLEAAKNASPLFHVTSAAPPFLILQGDADRVVPLEQSEKLHKALTGAGVESTLVVVPGAFHSAPAIFNNENMTKVKEFFDKHMRRAAAWQSAR